MKLPNANNAYIDLHKIQDYCLNPFHPRGKHKAAVFFSALGIQQNVAELLASEIQREISHADCEPGTRDDFGARYTATLEISAYGRNARVKTAWIILASEEFPRLTTCFIA